MDKELLANLDYTNPEIAELVEHYEKLETEKVELESEREKLLKQAEEKQKMIDRQKEEVGESRKLVSDLTKTVESLQVQHQQPEHDLDEDDVDDEEDDFDYTNPKVIAKLARKAVLSEVDKRFQNVATKEDVTKGIGSLINGLTATTRLTKELGMTPEQASEVTATAQELGIDVESAIGLLSKVRSGQSDQPDREKVTFEDEQEQKRTVAPPPETSSANAGAQYQLSHDVDWLKQNLAKGSSGADLIYDWKKKYPGRYRAANEAMSQGA